MSHERLKNLLSGNIHKKTKDVYGYVPTNEKKQEGDVWEESGKTWTIKNGIKRNVTKLDLARQMSNIPLVCPKCEKPFNHKYDEKFWKANHMCFECSVQYETNLRIEHKYKEYEQQKIKNNILVYLEKSKIALDDFIDSFDINSFMSETGDIERWNSTTNKEELKQKIKDQYNEMKNTLMKNQKI